MSNGIAATAAHLPRKSSIGLILGALGVVFGDIGTSAIYTVTALAKEQHASGPGDVTTVYGMVSTLIWSLILIVTILYVTIFLRADNNGEGGLLALLGLIRQVPRKAARRGIWIALAGVGAAMFLGDSIITPAISVLSAVEGLELLHGGLGASVVPITIVILVLLFLLQPLGINRVAKAFGPVMLLWFGAITVFGLLAVIGHPQVLWALSPHWIIPFFAAHPLTAFLSLGSVVLAVTGAEALYADMGQFGRKAIRRAWLFVVLPALTVAYLGQAATLVQGKSGPGGVFFAMVPEPLLVPMILIATAATVIASQAVISGAFTVIHQASRLDLMVPMRVVHTSEEEQHQVYLPTANWTLAAAVILIVVLFQSSQNLTSAYGLAVTITITITTSLFIGLMILRRDYSWPLWVAGAIWLIILVFLAANVPKIESGGWLPLLIGGVLCFLMFCWRSGRKQMRRWRRHEEVKPAEFLELLDEGNVSRVAGTGVFFTPSRDRIPVALHVMAKHQHAIPERIILFTWQNVHVPAVPAEERIHPEDIRSPEPGILSMTATYGYRERIKPLGALREVIKLRPDLFGDLNVSHVVFYLSLPIVEVVSRPPVKFVREIYALMVRMRTDPVNQLSLPRERTIIIGREVKL
ncbi:KUP/HAK/KT family potassium transporter [Gulosibacter molinativorax]|nr:KUP/HAK/KT family potassium transporter [Gulosibacter molinativorax]QUY63203.1 Probable potassium transport system protein kup [Gulosibacter molinativorax]